MSQTYDDPFAGATREKAESLKFPTEGTAYTGIVTEVPKLVQAKVYQPDGQGPLDWWDKEQTEPVMNVVINLTVDDEPRSLFAKKPSFLFNCLAEAQQQAGARIAPGGQLFVQYTGKQKTKNGYEQKVFVVKYAAPAAADPFAETPPTTAAGNGGRAETWGQKPAAPTAAPF